MTNRVNLPHTCVEWQFSVEDGLILPIMKGQNSDLTDSDRKLETQKAQMLLDLASKFLYAASGI